LDWFVGAPQSRVLRNADTTEPGRHFGCSRSLLVDSAALGPELVAGHREDYSLCGPGVESSQRRKDPEGSHSSAHGGAAEGAGQAPSQGTGEPSDGGAEYSPRWERGIEEIA